MMGFEPKIFSLGVRGLGVPKPAPATPNNPLPRHGRCADHYPRPAPEQDTPSSVGGGRVTIGARK